MKHLTVFDFPSIKHTDGTKMRTSMINYFNANRDNKDTMLQLQQVMQIMTRKVNECLQEHETDPRTPNGERALARQQRDAPIVIAPVVQPEVAIVIEPAQTQSMVGMATTGEAAGLVIPQLTDV